MNILAIDPGNEHSALCKLNSKGTPYWFTKVDNMSARVETLRSRIHIGPQGQVDHLVVEMIASYGMPVGKEVFDTCLWIGRFVEAWNGPFTLVYRREVKMFLCGNTTAKDSNVRQALIDRYGGKASIGLKKSPGPLYGISKDIWQALAVGVTWQGTHGKQIA